MRYKYNDVCKMAGFQQGGWGNVRGGSVYFVTTKGRLVHWKKRLRFLKGENVCGTKQ